jgi:hypothetical protein
MQANMIESQKHEYSGMQERTGANAKFFIYILYDTWDAQLSFMPPTQAHAVHSDFSLMRQILGQ